MGLLDRIRDRINKHYEIVEDFKSGAITTEEFESNLLKEINFLEQDLESKLVDEINEQEAILLKSFDRIREVIKEEKLDRQIFENILMSEIYKTMIDNKML